MTGPNLDLVASTLERVLPPRVAFRVVSLEDPGCASVSLAPSLSSAAPRRQVEFRAGRLAAQEALREAGAAVPCDLPIGPMRAPVWPKGFVGSIAHTKGVAVAAAAKSADVSGLGIDIEAWIPHSRAEGVSRMIGRPAELEALMREGHDASAACTLAFCAKEALFKCLAPVVQRYFGFHEATAMPGPGALTITLRLECDLHESLSRGAQFTAHIGVAGGLVVAGVARLP